MSMNVRTVSLGAGVFCISLAVLIQGILPFLHPESRTTEVTRVVRTDIGELKWMSAEATDYNPTEDDNVTVRGVTLAPATALWWTF